MTLETIRTSIEIVLLLSSLVALSVFIFYFILVEYKRCREERNFRKRIELYSEYVWIARDRYGLYIYNFKPTYDLEDMLFGGKVRRLPESLCPSIKPGDTPIRVKFKYEIIDMSDKKYDKLHI